MEGPAGQVWGALYERALRFAARAHEGQYRKGSEDRVPYVQHVAAVGWILDRAGFGPEVVAAGLLHDVIEDTGTSLEEIARAFGPIVAGLVADCTERKTDERGVRRPWAVRKQEMLDHLAGASVEARAIGLADKLHNLLSIEADVAAGVEIWGRFHADRSAVLSNFRVAADRWGCGDDRLKSLAAQCLAVLERLEGGKAGVPGG